ncbi:MAG: uncharacterized protein KVP18_000878 [Porospora cf. gigantea A]|uniref:uncharacterized protein n=1 Tax=Porospora cf. gigantea A TaxID=2853593 RepID=UPI003559C96A|nr:MAG: hypothetical protein KVP18_000878 [Porospora cf. gigantea A]
MGFPEESTHYRHWIFQSPEDLAVIRNRARAEAEVEAFGATLDADLERLCVQFCGQGLLEICREKNLSYAITSSAVAFYSRFFLKRSAILYDPRKVLFTCVLLAAKSQDPSLPLRMKSLLAGVNGGVSIKEICHLEIPLLDALEWGRAQFSFSFHLFVLDTRTPMQNLCNEWFRQAKSGLSGDDVKKVNEQFGKLTQAAEQLALQLHMTDIHFLFTPTQVALAVFLHVFTDFVSSEDDFYQIIFRNGRGVSSIPQILPACPRLEKQYTGPVFYW